VGKEKGEKRRNEERKRGGATEGLCNDIVVVWWCMVVVTVEGEDIRWWLVSQACPSKKDPKINQNETDGLDAGNEGGAK
jgi:hypothetical protein